MSGSMQSKPETSDLGPSNKVSEYPSIPELQPKDMANSFAARCQFVRSTEAKRLLMTAITFIVPAITIK